MNASTSRRLVALGDGGCHLLRLQHHVFALGDLVALDLLVGRHGVPGFGVDELPFYRWPVSRLSVWKAMRSELEAAV